VVVICYLLACLLASACVVVASPFSIGLLIDTGCRGQTFLGGIVLQRLLGDVLRLIKDRCMADLDEMETGD
jgi:hypothetical protein